MTLTDLLAIDGFIMVNKILIKSIGLEPAIVLSELCSEYNYWRSQDKLKYGDWFYSSRENIKNNTGLSEHKQRQATKILIEKKIISVRKIGIPSRNFYKINEKAILKTYNDSRKILKNSVVKNFNNKKLKYLSNGYEKFEEQENLNLKTNNNKYNKNKKDNNDNCGWKRFESSNWGNFETEDDFYDYYGR